VDVKEKMSNFSTRTAGLAAVISLAVSLAVSLALSLAVSLAFETHASAEEPGERAEALIFGAAVNRFVGKQMPVTVQIRGDRASGIAPLTVTLSEARYCGALDVGHGRLIGVLRSGGEPSSGPPLLTGARDCQDKLNEVVQRLPTGADALAVVEIVAEWVPWQLRFSIGDVATSGPGAGVLSAALARAKASGALETIDTSAIHLQAARGVSLDLDLAVSFIKAGDAVLTTLTPAVPGGRGREPRPSFLDPVGAPAGTDAIAGATFAFANRVVALFSQDGPLVLESDGQAVEIRALQLAGSNGLLTVRGRATPRAIQETVRLAIESAGADLKIAEVRAEPELEDCGAASGLAALGCRARNTARSAAVGAVASGMTARYRGQLLRALKPPPPFSFEIAERRLTLRLTPSRARATNVGLVLYGRADLE
jgi:hypothetical protein